jgi:hypothetical protein|tara:strand:+ start:24 stop:239 length:216 start_codon:yes stop_codon:yes gene_type:complete
MSDMKIIVRIKNVYGKDLIYPVCEKAKAFATIQGGKTLTNRTINTLINELGYDLRLSTGEDNWKIFYKDII